MPRKPHWPIPRGASQASLAHARTTRWSQTQRGGIQVLPHRTCRGHQTQTQAEEEKGLTITHISEW